MLILGSNLSQILTPFRTPFFDENFIIFLGQGFLQEFDEKWPPWKWPPQKWSILQLWRAHFWRRYNETLGTPLNRAKFFTFYMGKKRLFRPFSQLTGRNYSNFSFQNFNTFYFHQKWGQNGTKFWGEFWSFWRSFLDPKRGQIWTWKWSQFWS